MFPIFFSYSCSTLAMSIQFPLVLVGTDEVFLHFNPISFLSFPYFLLFEKKIGDSENKTEERESLHNYILLFTSIICFHVFNIINPIYLCFLDYTLNIMCISRGSCILLMIILFNIILYFYASVHCVFYI